MLNPKIAAANSVGAENVLLIVNVRNNIKEIYFVFILTHPAMGDPPAVIFCMCSFHNKSGCLSQRCSVRRMVQQRSQEDTLET